MIPDALGQSCRPAPGSLSRWESRGERSRLAEWLRQRCGARLERRHARRAKLVPSLAAVSRAPRRPLEDGASDRARRIRSWCPALAPPARAALGDVCSTGAPLDAHDAARTRLRPGRPRAFAGSGLQRRGDPAAASLSPHHGGWTRDVPYAVSPARVRAPARPRLAVNISGLARVHACSSPKGDSHARPPYRAAVPPGTPATA